MKLERIFLSYQILAYTIVLIFYRHALFKYFGFVSTQAFNIMFYLVLRYLVVTVFSFFLVIKMVHLHAEAEYTSFIYAFRVGANLTATRLYDLLGDKETKTITHTVHTCCAL